MMNTIPNSNQMVQNLVQQTISNHFQQQQQGQTGMHFNTDVPSFSHGHSHSHGSHGHSHDDGLNHGHSH
jgi:hypothetical protein